MLLLLDAPLGAEQLNDTSMALGRAGVTDPAAVPNQQLVALKPISALKDFLQISFDDIRVAVNSEGEPVRKAHHVGIYRERFVSFEVH